ncbi:Flp pilus assembly protein TadD [Gillisia mitskevichiae]|uniref:Flp pilus assembly protein TadD n=1 Tax=Gillisia mitskevichiae TaxID=270921 RepID=A0A495PZF1_9FLAO|nr:tetratricopeptide repeat protein [Gillisia mitskevichiae]RKS55897.1 Flp pilus assembly protein TadD [Gillisia mitskevichiae]
MKKLTILIVLVFWKVGAQTPTIAIVDSLYAIGNYTEAIQQLEDLNENSDAVQLRLAKAYVASGDLDSAINTYKVIVLQNPNKLLSAIDYGELLIKAGELSSADSLFVLLSSKYPKIASFQFQRGIIKEKQKDSTYIAFLERTIEIDPNHQQALYKLAKDALSKRNFPLAEELSLQGLGINPSNASLLSILAQTYFNENSFFLAITPFEKLLELGQGNEFVHSKLGYCYYNENNFKDAIEQYKLALEYEDRNSDTHYNLGKLYARQGDLKTSETHLLMALLIKKQPVDAEFLSLALTYKLQEDYEKALKYFNSALEENPDNERALYERAIAADNYFKDKKAVLNYYQAYLSKYSKKGSEELIYLAEIRIRDIKEELHLNGE